jgi:uncharacterized protein DUF2484
MTTSLILALVWGVLANVSAMLPSKRNHWPAAWMLMATGVPIVGFVTFENGPLTGLLVLAAGISVLRWPVIYLTRWLKSLRKPSL